MALSRSVATAVPGQSIRNVKSTVEVLFVLFVAGGKAYHEISFGGVF
jgi:hypothetical protein